MIYAIETYENNFYKYEMISKILNWCFGYAKLEEKHFEIYIPEEATHVLVITGEKEIEVRKYHSLFKFRKIYLDKLSIPYDSSTDLVYDNLLTGFNKISLPEFIHLVLPNKELEIKRIPIDSYLSGFMEPTFSDYTQTEETYMCKCKTNSSKCVFHKFLIEKLYTKYKNAVFTTDPDNSHNNNDDWSLG